MFLLAQVITHHPTVFVAFQAVPDEHVAVLISAFQVVLAVVLAASPAVVVAIVWEAWICPKDDSVPWLAGVLADQNWCLLIGKISVKTWGIFDKNLPMS